MRRLILCADDFGLSEEISGAIAALAREGKINAISCMAACPGWSRDAALLRGLPASVEIGLHLVLSDEVPLTAMPKLAPDGHLPGIDALGWRAMLGRLPLDEIAREVAAQFDRFEQIHGHPPAFVDGHQHSHHLRGIRGIVLAQTAQRAPGAWLRSCVDSMAAMLARPFPLKAMVNAFQGRGFARDARRLGLRCNRSFAGLYDFSSDFSALVGQFMKRPSDLHLVICHPGEGELAGDGIAGARQREAAALRALPISDMAEKSGLRFGDWVNAT